ncbi:MAG: DUF2924 domain-containing protein [Victivallales bacterium]|nr:DUF2924 domain-containing protein [Victivallales bacterium]
MTETKDTLLKNLLVEIGQMNIQALRKYYKELYGVETKQKCKELLRRRIAYRLQERRYGGLSQADAEFLDSLADQDPLANLNLVTIPYQQGMKIIPGTKFVREWHGVTYEAIFRGRRQYEYRGRIYSSLTAISTLITGTHWSGTTFFGVRSDD